MARIDLSLYSPGGGGSGGRIVLQANLDIYVATTGSDTTGDGTIGNPFATPKFAAKYVSGRLDGNQFNVTVHVADGTYTDQFIIEPAFGVANYTWTGNTVTPANVIIKPNSLAFAGAVKFHNVRDNNLLFQGFTLDATDPGFGGFQPLNTQNTIFSLSNCVFTQVNNDGWYMITLTDASSGAIQGTNVFNCPGNQTALITLGNGSFMDYFGTMTLNGTPTFSAATLTADEYSQILWEPHVTGTATGIPVALTNYSSFRYNAFNAVPGTLNPTVDDSSIYNGAFGWNTFAGIPTTTQIPTPGTGGMWKDTSGGGVYLAFNDGGVIKKVALT